MGSSTSENGNRHMTFNNSHDTLIFIARQHGYTVLLGKKLRAFFTDYAPQLSKSKKNLVYAVFDNGAAAVLHKNLNSKQADKEIAVKQAAALLTEAFIARDAAEGIIREFAEALGWRLNASSGQRFIRPVPQPRLRQPDKSICQTGTENITANIIAANISDGEQIVRFGGYAWRVLDVQADKALLITEDIVEKRPYNHLYTDVTWETCTLRRYLNEEFLLKINYPERIRILEATNANANNRWCAAGGGNATKDKVFLLSVEETAGYFGDSGQLRSWKPGNLGYVSDKFNKTRSANYRNEPWWWWLRSPGNRGYNVANVGKNGHLVMSGNYADNWEGGVRPAVWINLDHASI